MKVQLLLALCVALATAATISYDVNSVAKDNTNPYFGQGFGIAYSINGTQGSYLKLLVGNTYRFKVNSACNHPFYITTDPSGQNASEVISPNINSADIFQVCNGEVLTWTPTEDELSVNLPPGVQYYYQCRSHSKMGFKIDVVADTFCNKYSRALSLTNKDLVSTVVGAVVGKVAAPTSLIREYFDGTFAGTTNFTDPKNAAALNTLVDHLVGFFGIALGCTDGSIPAYTGNPNMKTVHAGLAIGKLEFNYFNKQVIDVLAGAGVTSADQSAALGVLNSLKKDICNQNDCRTSICDVYSDALNLTNVDLVTTVVTGTFGLLVAPNSPLLPFFNGQVPAGSIDFTTNSNALMTLATHLVQFFGAALGCSDAGFPAYQGETDMALVHKNIPIGPFEFTTFNDDVIKVLAGAGVTPQDQAAVRGVLESLRSAICNKCVAPPTGATGPATTGGPADIITFAALVKPKTASNPYKDQGNPMCFYIDGAEAPNLVLQVGKQYQFMNSATCSHPFYITDDEAGANAGNTPQGLSFPAADAFGTCAGKFLTYTPAPSDDGKTFYYNCQNHQYMGAKVTICADPTKCNSLNPTTGVQFTSIGTGSAPTGGVTGATQATGQSTTPATSASQATGSQAQGSTTADDGSGAVELVMNSLVVLMLVAVAML